MLSRCDDFLVHQTSAPRHAVVEVMKALHSANPDPVRDGDLVQVQRRLRDLAIRHAGHRELWLCTEETIFHN